MAHVEERIHIERDRDALWRDVGRFQGVGDWHPMLAKIQGDKGVAAQARHLLGDLDPGAAGPSADKV